VTKVVWSGNGVAIVATESNDRPRGGYQRASSGCDCDSDCCRPRCRCDSHCNCLGGNVYDC
jgi:hypothetical protein